MWRDLLGVATAFGSSALYSLGVSIQASEAATTERKLALRLSLLVELARRRRWLLGAAIALAGWPLQVVALLLAPLTLVQPALAAGLVILVALGAHQRGARIGRSGLIGIVAIVAGIGGLAATAPARTTVHAPPARLVAVIALLALLVLAPFLMRALHRFHIAVVIASAGLAAAWSGISTKLVTDELTLQHWPGLIIWLAISAVAAILGLLSEMTALQVGSPTQVVPAIFVIEMIVPVMLAPYLAGEHWTTAPAGGLPLVFALALVTAGVATLAHQPAIASAVARAAPVGGAPPTTGVPGAGNGQRQH